MKKTIVIAAIVMLACIRNEKVKQVKRNNDTAQNVFPLGSNRITGSGFSPERFVFVSDSLLKLGKSGTFIVDGNEINVIVDSTEYNKHFKNPQP